MHTKDRKWYWNMPFVKLYCLGLHVSLGKYVVILKSYLAMLAYFVKEITLNNTLNYMYVCIFSLGNILKIYSLQKTVFVSYVKYGFTFDRIYALRINTAIVGHNNFVWLAWWVICCTWTCLNIQPSYQSTDVQMKYTCTFYIHDTHDN